METPQHIVALTRNEQRVVILIVLALLGLAVAKQYHDRSLGAPVTPPSNSAPAASPQDEEPAGPDETQ